MHIFQEYNVNSCKSEAHLERFNKICTEDALLEMKISLKKEWLKRYGTQNVDDYISPSKDQRQMFSPLSPDEVCMCVYPTELLTTEKWTNPKVKKKKVALN